MRTHTRGTTLRMRGTRAAVVAQPYVAPPFILSPSLVSSLSHPRPPPHHHTAAEVDRVTATASRLTQQLAPPAAAGNHHPMQQQPPQPPIGFDAMRLACDAHALMQPPFREVSVQGGGGGAVARG